MILAEGLKAGEQVAGRGSIILAQIYDDASSTLDNAPEKPQNDGARPTPREGAPGADALPSPITRVGQLASP